MMPWVILAGAGVSGLLALLAAPVVIRLSHRFGMLDKPGRHKTHERPMPLLGGSAILAAVLLPSALVSAVASVWATKGCPPWLPAELAIHVRGAHLIVAAVGQQCGDRPTDLPATEQQDRVHSLFASL